MSVSLHIANLEKIFVKEGERFAAVAGINLSVPAGELVTFLGPSGCGKTTTLRMVAGFETPSAGEIRIGDRDVTSVPANKREIGFVFQNYALFPHMKVFDNVAYGLSVRGEPRRQIAAKVREALAMVGLERTEGRYPNQLSGGEQQRVALARVLVLRPHLLLMDEPLSNLDAKLRLHMRSEIRRIQQDLSLTCLYVTHDQKEALTMSDRVVVMNRGHIEQEGTPLELYSEPATSFVADFIGRANLIPALLKAIDGPWGEVEAAGKIVRVRLHRHHSFAPGQAVKLVIRPENFSFQEDPSSLPVTVIGRQFEGDRVNYQARLKDGQVIEIASPFLPGSAMVEIGSDQTAAFSSQGAVVIPTQ